MEEWFSIYILKLLQKYKFVYLVLSTAPQVYQFFRLLETVKNDSQQLISLFDLWMANWESQTVLSS